MNLTSGTGRRAILRFPSNTEATVSSWMSIFWRTSLSKIADLVPSAGFRRVSTNEGTGQRLLAVADPPLNPFLEVKSPSSRASKVSCRKRSAT